MLEHFTCCIEGHRIMLSVCLMNGESGMQLTECKHKRRRNRSLSLVLPPESTEAISSCKCFVLSTKPLRGDNTGEEYGVICGGCIWIFMLGTNQDAAHKCRQNTLVVYLTSDNYCWEQEMRNTSGVLSKTSWSSDLKLADVFQLSLEEGEDGRASIVAKQLWWVSCNILKKVNVWKGRTTKNKEEHGRTRKWRLWEQRGPSLTPTSREAFVIAYFTGTSDSECQCSVWSISILFCCCYSHSISFSGVLHLFVVIFFFSPLILHK